MLHLCLFGSVARGEATANSDIDLAAEFDPELSLSDVAGISDRLTDILGAPADLSEMDRLKDYVRANFDREAELLF